MKKDAAGRKSNPGATSGMCHRSPSPPAPPGGMCNAAGVCVDFYTGQSDLADALTAAAAADVVLVFMVKTFPSSLYSSLLFSVRPSVPLSIQSTTTTTTTDHHHHHH
jgi:hypothetical protein